MFVLLSQRIGTCGRSSKDGEFLLYYRQRSLAGFSASIASNGADIPEFVRYFVEQFAISMDKVIETIPEETMRSLVRHPHPFDHSGAMSDRT